MQSLDSDNNGQAVTKTVLLLFGVAINALEFFIPRLPFFPWLKPGFANIITLLWIIEFGAIDALLYSLLRVWIVGFFFGFSLLTMSLALSGGVLSTVAMSLLWAGLGKRKMLGTVGIGVCGAVFHNSGQLLAVYCLMAANMRLFYQVPVMLVASVIFGGLVGLLVPPFRTALISCGASVRALSGRCIVPGFTHASVADYCFSLLLLAGCCAIVFTGSIIVLGVSACGATIIAQVRNHRVSLKLLFAPLSSFWVLFVFIACVNIFFSYGTRIERLPFITHEGLDVTVRQWLRLWTWLEVSFILSYFNFHAVMLSMLQKLFPHHRSTLFAGVLCLEYFPAIASYSKAYAKKAISSFFKDPFGKMRRFMSKMREKTLSGIVAGIAEKLFGIIAERMEKNYMEMDAKT
jgi:heptaprenyl diphosphate synthase